MKFIMNDIQITTAIKRPALLEEAKQFITHNLSPSNISTSTDTEEILYGDGPLDIVLRYCENLATVASTLSLHEVCVCVHCSHTH